MTQSDLRGWLRTLEARSHVVSRYMAIHRSQFKLQPWERPPDDLEPAVLLGLAEVLVGAYADLEKSYYRYASTQFNTPIIITAGEWPERTVIEKSEVVYFGDFLKSFWRRLRRRHNP